MSHQTCFLSKVVEVNRFSCWGVIWAVLPGGRDEAPGVFARSSPWQYSFPLLINFCELSSGNKRWGRGSYSARPGPAKACELIALIEWEGLLSSGFLSLAGLVWKGMNGGPLQLLLARPSSWDPL